MENKIWKQVSGRIKAVAFYCQRCEKIQFEIITDKMVERSEDYLQSYDAPDGWGEHGYGLLCPDCFKQYKEFMSGAEVEINND